MSLRSVVAALPRLILIPTEWAKQLFFTLVHKHHLIHLRQARRFVTSYSTILCVILSQQPFLVFSNFMYFVHHQALPLWRSYR